MQPKSLILAESTPEYYGCAEHWKLVRIRF